jgi:hypothetical protein
VDNQGDNILVLFFFWQGHLSYHYVNCLHVLWDVFYLCMDKIKMELFVKMWIGSYEYPIMLVVTIV